MITACNSLAGQRPVPARLRRLLPPLLALTLVLAACGDDDESAGTTASASDTASSSEPAEAASTADEADDGADDASEGGTDDEASDGAYPVTIAHDLGSTTVPAAPQRVVAMTDQGELAALLALDVTPVAYGQRIPGEVDYLAAEGAYAPEIEIFPSDVEINFERLTAFEPDLIVGQIGFITPENLELFEAIAPTIPIAFDDWREGLLDVGAAIDDVASAEAKIAELEAMIAGFPARVPSAEGRSVSVALGIPNFGIYQLTNQSVLAGYLESAGVAPLPDPTNEQDPSGNQLSEEQLDLVDGEALIVLDFSGAAMGGGGDSLGFFEANPLWSSLPAVQGDRVRVWSGGDAAASNFTNALTIPVQLDLLEAFLNDVFAE